MNIFKASEHLPPENKYVLVYVPEKPWQDDDQLNVFWDVAKLVKGISMKEREQLSDNNPRKKCFYSADEFANNILPYIWQTFGPEKYNGNEVKFWCYLPNIEKYLKTEVIEVEIN